MWWWATGPFFTAAPWRTAVWPGKVVPPGSLVVGVPGKVIRQVTAAEQAETLENAAHYVRLGRQQLAAAGPEEEEK